MLLARPCVSIVPAWEKNFQDLEVVKLHDGRRNAVERYAELRMSW